MLPQAADFAAASRLSLGRLNLETRIPYAQAVPASDPAGAFARELAETLGTMLAPVCDNGDPSVWIIRRLDFDFAGGKAWEPGRIAEALTGQMRTALLRVFSGEASSLAVRFPDRAAYLAQFLADLADGSAWDRWYFSAFHHLRTIPVRIAACMALEAEPELAFAVLGAMEKRGRLPRFLAGLGENDTNRILRLLADGGPAEPDPAAMIAVCQYLLARSDGSSLLLRSKGRLQAIVSVATTVRLSPGSIAVAIDAVFERMAQPLATAPLRQDVSDMPASELADIGDGYEPNKQKFATLLRRLKKRTGPAHKRIRPKLAASEGIVTTRAGVFLLWRSVMDIGLDAGLTAGCTEPEAAARRHRLAVALSGPYQADADDDEALRWLTRHEAVAAEAEVISAEDAQRLQQALFETLTGLRPARPLQLAIQQENGISILQDAVTQDWYVAAREPGMLRLPEADIASILIPSGLTETLLRRWPGLMATPLADPSHLLLTREKPAADALAEAARTAENLRPAGPDLVYLAGADEPGAAGLALMLFARAAYADLGRRLPGLTLSSAAYLGRNAVHGVGRLRENAPGGDADADIDLPSVPFDFIWRMTGLNGTVYRLADGRSIQLNMARASS